jgi:hypothetical protein
VSNPKNQVLYVFDCSKLNRHAALMFFEEWNFINNQCCVVSFPCCENGTCITGSYEILLKHVGPLVPDAALLSSQSLWTSSGVQAKESGAVCFGLLKIEPPRRPRCFDVF